MSRDRTRLTGEDFEAAFDNSLDGMLVATPEGEILAVNPAACRMLQRTEDEMMALGRQGIIDENDDRWRAAIAQRNATGEVRAEMTHRRADGSTFEVEVASTEYTLANGERRACVSWRDISDTTELIDRQGELAGALFMQLSAERSKSERSREGSQCTDCGWREHCEDRGSPRVGCLTAATFR